MSARHAAESAAAASWFNRWMTIGSSEWMIAQPPAAWTSAAFSSIASNTSILYPHQLAQVATQISSFASSGAILYASLAWGKVRNLKADAVAISYMLALSSRRGQWC